MLTSGAIHGEQWQADVPPPLFPFRRIMVTGGGGFVGRRFVTAVRRSVGSQGRVLACVFSKGAERPSVGTVSVDIRDRQEIRRVIGAWRPDLVVHLAAQSSVVEAEEAVDTTWSTNVDGSAALAEAIVETGTGATVMFASSAEVYGGAFRTGEVSELTEPVPETAYAESKLAAEKMLTQILPTGKLIITRPCNHSGPGQDARFVLPSFAAQIRSGVRAIQVGNLSSRRDFLHVDDVIDAMLALLMVPAAAGKEVIFNIASGRTISISKLLRKMIAMAQADVSIELDPARFRPIDTPSTRISARRLHETTGWAPVRSIDKMLEEILSSA